MGYSSKDIVVVLKYRVFVSLIIVSCCAAFWTSVAGAQSSTPAATCDSSYGSEAFAVYKSSSAAYNNGTPSKVSDIAALAIQSAQLRIQYEDTPAPAGCESVRALVIQLMRINEDSLYLTIAALVDNKNADSYNSFFTSVWQPRFKALTTTVQAISAGTPTAPAAPADGPCTDKGFQKQAVTDLNSFSTSQNDVGTVAPLGLSSIKLRYGYEDMTPPATCGAARNDMVQVLSFVEDNGLVILL